MVILIVRVCVCVFFLYLKFSRFRTVEQKTWTLISSFSFVLTFHWTFLRNIFPDPSSNEIDAVGKTIWKRYKCSRIEQMEPLFRLILKGLEMPFHFENDVDYKVKNELQDDLCYRSRIISFTKVKVVNLKHVQGKERVYVVMVRKKTCS